MIATLNEMKVKGTLFMAGRHVTTKWRRHQVTAAQASPYIQVGNHSNTHANHKYTDYYKNPDKVVEGFEETQKILKPAGPKKIARLPGWNTWGVGKIMQNDKAGG